MGIRDHDGNRPSRLEAAVIAWADASADLAAGLRQLDYDARLPHLRLAQPGSNRKPGQPPQPPRHHVTDGATRRQRPVITPPAATGH